MAGLTDTDIRLNDDWQLTAAANGAALLVSDLDCLMQDIRLEAMSQAGELWYAEDWGWSLLDFMQAQDDELTRIEIEQRVKDKLATRPLIDTETIQTRIDFAEDAITISVSFSLTTGEDAALELSLDRIKIEVIAQ